MASIVLGNQSSLDGSTLVSKFQFKIPLIYLKVFLQSSRGGGGGGFSLTFGTGVLMCLFGVGEIILSLTSLVCHCPNHFLSFRNWTADYLCSLKKLV